MKGSGRIVALKIDGEIQIHAAGDGFGDYDSLCGIDADDPKVGHEGYAELPKKAKIDCAACYSHFLSAKTLRKSDFSEEVKRRVA